MEKKLGDPEQALAAVEHLTVIVADLNEDLGTWVRSNRLLEERVTSLETRISSLSVDFVERRELAALRAQIEDLAQRHPDHNT